MVRLLIEEVLVAVNFEEVAARSDPLDPHILPPFVGSNFILVFLSQMSYVLEQKRVQLLYGRENTQGVPSDVCTIFVSVDVRAEVHIFFI